MKPLIVYYSYSGNNLLLAEQLQSLLGCDMYPVVEKTKRTGFGILLDLIFQRDSKIEALPVSVKNYDHVLFIAPIWAARIATPLKTLIKKEKESLRQYSFVSLCGYESSKQKEKIRAELIKLVGFAPQFISELRVSDLFPAQDRMKINVISNYRVKPEDFHHYQAQIGEIVKNLGNLPPTPERRPPHETVGVY